MLPWLDYLITGVIVRYGCCQKAERIEISQGRQVGRPSRICGWVAKNGAVTIQGDVVFFASGILTLGVLQHLASEAAEGAM